MNSAEMIGYEYKIETNLLIKKYIINHNLTTLICSINAYHNQQFMYFLFSFFFLTETEI